MMKKALVGFAALGAIIAFRPVVRRLEQKMREHCAQMAAQCEQIGAHVGGRDEASGQA